MNLKTKPKIAFGLKDDKKNAQPYKNAPVMEPQGTYNTPAI